MQQQQKQQRPKPHIPERLLKGSGVMVSKFKAWVQRVRKPLVIVAVIVGVLALLVVFALGYRLNWDWTGLGPYSPPNKDSNFQREKTLWDWLQLLIIPAVLAVGGFWLNQIQKSREEKATEQRTKIEREAAEKRAQAERDIALDNQREAALKEYFDKMSELLLHE